MTAYSHEQIVLRVRPGSRFLSWVLHNPLPGEGLRDRMS